MLCPSCGIELLSGEELDSPDGSPEPKADISDLHLLRTERVDWIKNLIDKLADAEIPFRVLPHHQGGTASVYVRDEDREKARRIDHVVYQSEVHGTEAVRYTKDLQFESCPACGAPLGEAAQECRSCGLIMSGRGWQCDKCHGELEGSEEACPYCGETINWDDA
jgi:hypothetical protein